MRARSSRSALRSHDGFNDSTERIEPKERPMSASNEFWNVALLTAIFVGVAFLSRLI
jgi:hypothetical protein